MAILKRLALLLGLGLAGGCGFLREPTPLEFTDPQLLVASMLESGSPTVNVLLVRLDPRAARFPGQQFDLVAPISGATVLIFRGADTVRLQENAPEVRRCLAASFFQEETPSGPGCYGAFLPGGVRSGERYGLLIRLPGGGEVRGETVVPDSVPILLPTAHAHYLAQPARIDERGVARIPVRWGHGTPGAAGLRLTLQHAAVFEGNEAVARADCNLPATEMPLLDSQRADSATFRLRYVDCNVVGPIRRPIAWDSIHARLAITVHDSAYTRYESAWNGHAIEHRQAAAGLTGALGVFAASAVSRQPIVLVTPQVSIPDGP